MIKINAPEHYKILTDGEYCVKCAFGRNKELGIIFLPQDSTCCVTLHFIFSLFFRWKLKVFEPLNYILLIKLLQLGQNYYVYVLKYHVNSVDRVFSEFKTLSFLEHLIYILTKKMGLNNMYLMVLLWRVIKSVHKSKSQNLGNRRCSICGI